MVMMMVMVMIMMMVMVTICKAQQCSMRSMLVAPRRGKGEVRIKGGKDAFSDIAQRMHCPEDELVFNAGSKLLYDTNGAAFVGARTP